MTSDWPAFDRWWESMSVSERRWLLARLMLQNLEARVAHESRRRFVAADSLDINFTITIG